VLAAEHFLRLAGIDLDREIVERPSQIVHDRLSRLGPFGQHREVVDPLAQGLAEIPILFDPAPPLQQLLRSGLVLPEIRRGDAVFYFPEFIRRAGGVKDSSAGPSRGGSDPRTCEAVHRAGKTTEGS
jgi:hypothetical protein